MVVIKKTTDRSLDKIVKKTVSKKAVKKTAVKKTASKKVAVKRIPSRKNTLKESVEQESSIETSFGSKPSVKTGVTNKKIQGMIQANVEYASKARKSVFVDSEVMPTEYGSTSITLLARDPHWVHAYWEVASSSFDELRKKIGDAVDRCAYVLRVYDVSLIEFNGLNANHWFDIVVGRESNNWYINLWSDHITCCADIGLRAPDGTFYTLSRSNYVTTPREFFSPRQEMIWMEVQLDAEAKPYVYVGRDPEPGQQYPDGKKPRRFRIYLTEEEIRAYYSRLFPLLSKILALRSKAKRNGKTAGGPYGEYDELLVECLEGIEMYGYDYFRKILLGASEEMMLRGRKLLEVLGGASEQFVESSRGSEQKPRKQDFFFELGTELIVYGRTEPDAVVFWGDRMIPLRADGTFTLRMALPTDTNIPLDFKAVSYHKNEQRTIITAANREKTEYSN
jgi:hypothetical protein